MSSQAETENRDMATILADVLRNLLEQIDSKDGTAQLLTEQAEDALRIYDEGRW